MATGATTKGQRGHLLRDLAGAILNGPGPRVRVLAATVVIALAVLVPVTAARAVTASPEPAFTIPQNGQNYWWWSYTTRGTGYHICTDISQDGATPGTANCFPEPSSGTATLDVFYPVTSGSLYTACAYERDPSDTVIAGRSCSSTTIDTSPPTATSTIDGGAAYTNNPLMHLTINYADTLSEPWPGASTIDCWHKDVATGCQNAPGAAATFQPDGTCSSPAADNSPTFASSSWTCDYDISKLAGFSDGTWAYCVQESDSARPDNPSSSDQLTSTPSQANVSPVGCASIILDRDPPTVTATASATKVTTGQTVTFGVTAGDTASGTSGTYDWDFGDGSAHGSGSAPTHAYAAAGTYTVGVTTHDRAGNAATGTETITVSGAPGSGAGTGGSGSGGTGGTGTGGTGTGGTGTGGTGTGTKHPGPLHRVNSTIIWTLPWHGTGVKVSQLDVLRAPVGGAVHTACAGSGCPFAAHTTPIRARKSICKGRGKARHCTTPATTTVKLAGLFAGHHLTFGTRVTVQILKRTWIGKVYVFRMSKNVAPSIDCLAPGSMKPGKGC
jgi:hypothetical protein